MRKATGACRRVGARLIAVLMVLSLVPVTVNASFSVKEQLIEVQARHNEHAAGAITVSNHSEEPITIRVIPADYLRDLEGEVSTPVAGETVHSLFPHVSLSSTLISLEPHGSYDLEYVINLPEDVEGSRWFAIYFEPDVEPMVTQDQDRDKANFSIKLVIAYRTLILATATGTEAPNGTITGMRMVEAPDFGFEIELQNTGNVYYRATGWIDIRDEQGETVTRIPIERSFVLPDQTLVIRVLDKELDLPPGRYLALAVIDFGGDHLVASQLVFDAY